MVNFSKSNPEEQANRKWSLQNEALFEEFVLARAWLDLAFYKQIYKGLCRDSMGRFVGDFSVPIHTSFFYILTHYNATFVTQSTGSFTPMPYAYLESMGAAMAAKGDELNPYDVPQLADLFNRLCARAQNHMATSMLDQLFPFYFGRRKAHRLAESFQLVNTFDDVGSAMDLQTTLQREVELIQLNNDRSHFHRYPPGEIWKDQGQVERRPTQHAGLNKCLGGGWGKGEAALVIAPSNAGKSVAAAQWSGEMIAGGWKGALVISEGTSRRFRPRYYANFGKISYNLIKDGVRMDKLDDPQVARINELDGIMHNKLVMLEWDGKGFCIDDHLSRDLDAVEEELGGLDFVVFDWLSASVLRSVSEGRGPSLTQIMERSAAEFASMCTNRNIAGLLFAQANPMQSKNKKIIDKTMTYNCKSLHFNMVQCVGISALEAKGAGDAPKEGEAAKDFEEVYDDRQYFSVTKTRFGVNGVVPFRRAYHQQRIEYLSQH